jgi:hypothetical protein
MNCSATMAPVESAELGEVGRTAGELGRNTPPLGADGLGALEGYAYDEYGFPDDDRLCR